MLDDKTLGHLRHMVNLSRQIPNDWSDMGPYDPSQEGDDAYRYQLAYMTYALALTQYHHTPAYRELWRDTIGRLIAKMMRWEVWGYWELTSRGSKVMDPDMNGLGEGWIDPVMRQNVMYSGHLLMMVGLYDMFYRDGRFDAPGSLTFQFRPVFRGMGPEDFPYDHGKLARTIFAEFERNDFMGCECEPNGIFVYCNQFPILGFMHYDHTHGTDLAARTVPQFKDRWQRRSTMFGSNPKADLPILFRKRQNDFIYEESEDNNEGITAVAWASVMHTWAPEYVELVYPRARDQILRRMEDGTLGVNLAGYFAKYKEYQRNPGHHATDPMMVGVHIFGTLALAAAEVGDTETLNGLLAYADKYLSPKEKNGGVFYPRNDDMAGTGYCTALVGNALIAGARLCPRDGFRAMYDAPWGAAELSAPELCDVDFPAVLVREAVHPKDGGLLRVTLAPGLAATGRQTVAFRGLDLTRSVSVMVDGVKLIVPSDRDEAAADDLTFMADRKAGLLRLTLLLNRDRRIIIG
ncbi:MAG: hypothetical protein O9292_14550 [Rhodobacteraceae bacterium]|nr:hypothetical protein [Paracoccaceae bacterium]